MLSYTDILAQFFGNRLLFGDPSESGLVAAEVKSPHEVELFRRSEGRLLRATQPIELFILFAAPQLLSGSSINHRLEELKGEFNFRYLARFDSVTDLEAAKRHLRSHWQAGGEGTADYFVLSDVLEQHLMLRTITHFAGLQFDDLHRLQLDVQACISPGFEFPSGARPGDRIAALAVTDNRGFERVLSGAELEEKSLLKELGQIIAERDPDIIEGHNLFRQELEYLEARARLNRMPLRWGRDGSTLKGRSGRLQIAERTIAYRRYQAYGRHLVDTGILLQHYDIGSRELSSLELAEVERHFHLPGAPRHHLEPEQVNDMLAREPTAVADYALENARQTGRLAAILSLSYFMQAQIFPYGYQNVILRGNATKIDALMLRAYLAAGHSIPKPAAPEPVTGGYTEVRRLGVAHEVAHCDVTSLYPSLMLQFGHGPRTDSLGVFLRMLSDLRHFRVEAKAALRGLEDGAHRYLEALQQTFKILINSFYGYLGFGLGHFNDFEQANHVTRRGRELIQAAIAELEARGAQVIEADTDGIYFVAPPAPDGADSEPRLLEHIAAVMPEGISLEIDGHYPAMFSYKIKNYVLLDREGELTIRGSGLKSRGLERFQRRFMEEMFALLLNERRAQIPALLERYRGDIASHRLAIRELGKTETLQDSLEVYRQKISAKRRNPAAAYELALKSARPYASGDQISYYVSGHGIRVKVNTAARLVAEYRAEAPDENVEYYLAKLDDLFDKFKPYLERAGLFPAAALLEQTVEQELKPPTELSEE